MHRRAALALLVLMVATGCAGDDGDAAPSSPGATSDDGCAAGDGDPTELEALLPEAVPEGFTVQPDAIGDTGPSDLEKAVRDDGGDDAEAVLTDLRYRRGYQRLWTNEPGDALVLYLYEFCTADGARGYVARGVAEIQEAELFERFDVASHPDADGFHGANEDEQAAVITATSGPYLVQVVASAGTGERAEVVTERVTMLFEAQLALVPS